MRKWILAGLLLAIMLGVTACTGGGDSAAAQAVESYFEAVVTGDADAMSTLVCPEFEDMAYLEMDSFIGVTAETDNVVCTQSGEGDAVEVTCTGKILASYGNEQQEFDLAGRTFDVVNREGEWLVCASR